MLHFFVCITIIIVTISDYEMADYDTCPFVVAQTFTVVNL